MKIKLSICTKDEGYASRVVNYFSTHYDDRVELSAFTDVSLLEDYVTKMGTDICLVGWELLDEVDSESRVAAMALILTEEKDVEVDGFTTIFKYQKAEMIYKNLLNFYADNKKGNRVFKKHTEGEAHTYAFCSASGGAGATTVALSYAMKVAKERTVLYLDLQQYSNSDVILQGEGTGKFDDVIFALKSKRGSLSLKLESLVRKSKENVQFFAPCDNPMDIMELTPEEVKKLLRELVTCGLYEVVIVDIDSELNEINKTVMDEVEHIIIVEGGDESNRKKLGRFYTALETCENREGLNFISKIRLFYNKFSNKTGKEMEEISIPIVGGSPKIEGVTMEGIISRIMLMDCLKQLLTLEKSEV